MYLAKISFSSSDKEVSGQTTNEDLFQLVYLSNEIIFVIYV